MSEHRYKQTVCREYSQGVCHDGAAILKDGEPMTIEQILDDLRAGQAARAQQAGSGEAVAWAKYFDGQLILVEGPAFLTEDALSRSWRPLVYAETHPQPAQQGSVPDGEPDLFWDYDNPEDSGQESAYELADYCAQDLPPDETMVVGVMCAKRLPNRQMKIWIDEEDDVQWQWLTDPNPPAEGAE